MKKLTILLLASICCSTIVLAQNKEIPPVFILLKNASIIDGVGEEAKKGTILIKDNQIDRVVYDQEITSPKGAIIYDLTEKFIVPGLIDAHVHFGTSPSSGDNLEDTKKRLAYLLKNGVTAVRDMAGDARFLGFLARNAALNEMPSPNIYYSALMAGSTFFDDPRTHASAKGATPGDCPWMKAVDLNTDMKLAVAESKGTSASGIKVYADLEATVIEKIVAEAHRQNIKVWSHATVFPAKPLAIVQAGVDVVSHATLLAWEGLDYLPASAKGRYAKQENFNASTPVFKNLVTTMQAKGTILDATLVTYQHERFDTTIFQQGVALTKLAYENGVKIGVGTDMGVDDFPTLIPLVKEMGILVNQVGMTPMEVLKAVTLVNAEMIGQEHKIGTLESGKRADIIVLDANPLDNIHNVSTVKYVFKNGKRMIF